MIESVPQYKMTPKPSKTSASSSEIDATVELSQISRNGNFLQVNMRDLHYFQSQGKNWEF